MGNGISLEQLMQIFFAAEGLALWKVPAPAANTITDVAINEVCEKILSGGGTPTERSKRATSFASLATTYSRLHKISSFFCSFYPLIIFIVVLIFVSLLCDINNDFSRIWITGFVGCYFAIKLIIVLATKWTAHRYDAKCKEIAPVSMKESQKVTRV